MQSHRQVARNLLPFGPDLRLGVTFFTQVNPCMYMRSRPDVRRQHDAGEMLEHWVAAGRVSGRWEARIAERMLVKIRHFATTMSPINLDLPETAGTISLQQLVLEWHANQPGVQALADAPQLLMVRLVRFTRRANQTCKNTASVAIPTTAQMLVFETGGLPLFRAVEHDPQVLVQGYVLLLCKGTSR